MLLESLLAVAFTLLSSLSYTTAILLPQHGRAYSRWANVKRQVFPQAAKDVKTFTTPQGVRIRYKEPGKAGVCETTPGVNSYSGFIDLAPNVHIFFWFFESRRDPANDDFTLWLNGGPGADALIGLFEELGPCRISNDTGTLKSVLNPYSWTNVSNMLFLSQPVGVGFSYQELAKGSISYYTGAFIPENEQNQNKSGIWPILDPLNEGTINSTDMAAIAAWSILQGFLGGLSGLVGNRAKKVQEFNLWTESYGGHYGPSFFNYFQKQNELVAAGKQKGYHLNMKSLGLINAIVNEYIQAPYFPEFATKNTYGIVAYNQTVYDYAKFSLNMKDGCLERILECIFACQYEIPGGNTSDAKIGLAALQYPAAYYQCSQAADMCRNNVEYLYYNYAGRSTYDIRHPQKDPTPISDYYIAYMNEAYVQNAIGVASNYTRTNYNIYSIFGVTGDFVYPNFLIDLQEILDSGVRVALFYGDAGSYWWYASAGVKLTDFQDYICNWFGGEALSKQVGYKNQAEFNESGYTPFVVDGFEYGATREYGNFSFTRIYESGHEIPFYQREHPSPFSTEAVH